MGHSLPLKHFVYVGQVHLNTVFALVPAWLEVLELFGLVEFFDDLGVELDLGNFCVCRYVPSLSNVRFPSGVSYVSHFDSAHPPRWNACDGPRMNTRELRDDVSHHKY